jgi:hypothetical protein
LGLIDNIVVGRSLRNAVWLRPDGNPEFFGT